MNFKNIPQSLCNLCGTCIFICPKNCLSAKDERIIFDQSKCINCGLCYNNCQGIEFDFQKARKLFKSRNFHELIGGYDSIYLGQSKDKKILENSSSGGLVPEFLIYALEKGIIEGAILVIKDKNDPLGYKITIAKTKEEILERCQSLYRLIPVNTVLKEIKKEENLGFVSVPCQVEAIRKLQMNSNPQAKKIKLIAGIFCGLNQSFKSIEFLLKKLNVKKEDVVEFSQRKKDFKKGLLWPAGFYIRTKENKEYFLAKDLYEYLYYKYASSRCLLCYDYTNEFADVSFGDGWSKLPSKEGWSDIIIRSNLAKKIVLGLKNENKIKLEKSNLKNILDFHPGHISLKKKGIFRRLKKSKYRPEFNIFYKTFDKKTEYSQIMTFALIRFIRSSLMTVILNILPLWLIGKSTSLLRKTLRIVMFRRKK